MKAGARTRRWALTTGWLGGLALAIAIPPLAIAATAASDDQAGSFDLFASGIAVIAALTATVGYVLRLRVPDNRVGALLFVGGTLLASVAVAWMATVLLEAANGPLDVRAGLAAVWGYVMLPIAIFLGYALVGIYFPDGRLPGPRWRIPVGVLVAALVGASVITALTPFQDAGNLALNPIAVTGMPVVLSRLATVLTGVALFGSFLVATAAATTRWRRSLGVERAQMKWFVGGFIIAMALFLVSWGSDFGGAAIDVLSVMGMSLIPIAIGIAVLRYRLYEIDRIVSRTIGYGLVTGLLVIVFGGAVIALEAILAGVAQTGGETLAVAASTLVAFALFQPLRRRVQRAVDRRFDRSRYDGERTSAAFSERLRDEVDLAAVTFELDAVVRQAMAPTGVGTWLRGARR